MAASCCRSCCSGARRSVCCPRALRPNRRFSRFPAAILHPSARIALPSVTHRCKRRPMSKHRLRVAWSLRPRFRSRRWCGSTLRRRSISRARRSRAHPSTSGFTASSTRRTAPVGQRNCARRCRCGGCSSWRSKQHGVSPTLSNARQLPHRGQLQRINQKGFR